MTEIFVFSRAFAEGWHPPEASHVIISVTTPATREADLRQNEHTREIMRLSFDDRTTEPGILFNEVMATQIVDAMVRHLPIDQLVVHCEAGISRSAAIAAALARAMFGHDDASYFERYVPNMLVYRLVRQACARAGVKVARSTGAHDRLVKLAPPPEHDDGIFPADYLALIARYGRTTFGNRVHLCEPVREGELLVWACTDDGYKIAWRAEGPAESWGVVVVSDAGEYDFAHLDATSFLAGWLDGSVFVPALQSKG